MLHMRIHALWTLSEFRVLHVTRLSIMAERGRCCVEGETFIWLCYFISKTLVLFRIALFFYLFFYFKSLIHYALCLVFDCWLTIGTWLLMLTHMLLFMFFFGSIYLYIIVINIVYLSLFPHMRLCFILLFEKKVSNLYTRHLTSL